MNNHYEIREKEKINNTLTNVTGYPIYKERKYYEQRTKF